MADIDLSSPEIKAAIEAEVSAKLGEVETRYKTDIAKLTANRDEILQEKRRYSDLEKSLGELSIDDVKSYAQQLQQNKEAKLISEGKIDELVNSKIERARADYEGKLEAMQKDLSTREQQISKLLIDQEATNSFIGAGGLPEAVADAIVRARSVFSVENGECVARDKEGHIIKGANGALTIKEFMQSADYLKGSAKHLYTQPHGAGARGGAGGMNGEANPWAKETLNLTAQARIARENPEKAAMLKAAAGR